MTFREHSKRSSRCGSQGETEGKTLTWQYLRAINHQLRVLGPMMNQLTSTGVFLRRRRR